MRSNCCAEIFVPYIVFLLNIIFCASLQCALDLKGKYRLPESRQQQLQQLSI